MKGVIFIICLVWAGLVNQSGQFESKVYKYVKNRDEKTSFGRQNLIMKGTSVWLEKFVVISVSLAPQKIHSCNPEFGNDECLMIVKEGKIRIYVDGKSKTMGKGSAALVMPGDFYSLENAGDNESTVLVVKYQSKKSGDTERGKEAGGSVILDWNDIVFTPHDKGGVRKFFDRKSAMSERIEMHITTLNPGIKSHEPHTPNPAEIVVMLDGTSEMEIDKNLFQG
jgi:(S)-ureidoglycine aminohydrolase